MEIKILEQRNDTLANWVGLNPILKKGQLGICAENSSIKVGDGVARYNDLVYYNKLFVSDLEDVYAPNVPKEYSTLVYNAAAGWAYKDIEYISNSGDSADFYGEYPSIVTNGYILSNYTAVSTSSTTIEQSVEYISLNPLGNKAFVMGNSTLYEYYLETPNDIETAVLSGRTFAMGASIDGFCFKDGGDVLYTYSNFNDTIYVYKLKSPWNIVDATLSYSTLLTYAGAASGIMFSPDGRMLYLTNIAPDLVRQYKLTIPWDVSEMALEGFISTDIGTNPKISIFSPDGLNIWVNTSQILYHHTLSTAWDITSNTFVSSTDMYTLTGIIPIWFAVTYDGTKIICCDPATPTVTKVVTIP